MGSFVVHEIISINTEASNDTFTLRVRKVNNYLQNNTHSTIIQFIQLFGGFKEFPFVAHEYDVVE